MALPGTARRMAPRSITTPRVAAAAPRSTTTTSTVRATPAEAAAESAWFSHSLSCSGDEELTDAAQQVELAERFAGEVVDADPHERLHPRQHAFDRRPPRRVEHAIGRVTDAHLPA